MQDNILITGASGRLGRILVERLQKEGMVFSGAGRTQPEDHEGNWHFMDLASGNGIDEAIKGKTKIFHLASGTQQFERNTDVEGTLRLLDAAKNNHVSHFIYISIVGIDRVPMTYYRYKLEAEDRIRASGIPYSILRATQFHDFLHDMFTRFLNWPLVILPRHAKFQPVDTGTVAEALLHIAQQPATQSTHQLGGPEVLELDSLFTTWKQAQHKKARIIPLPAIGTSLKALVNGALTIPENRQPGTTWQQWLSERYAP